MEERREREKNDCRREKKKEEDRKKKEDECRREEIEESREIRERKEKTNQPSRICYFWTQGYCKKKNNCDWEHEDGERGGGKEKEKEKEKKNSTRCYFNENTKCLRKDCTFYHARRVCREYNKNRCNRGQYCDDNHPKRTCKFWNRGY